MFISNCNEYILYGGGWFMEIMVRQGGVVEKSPSYISKKKLNLMGWVNF